MLERKVKRVSRASKEGWLEGLAHLKLAACGKNPTAAAYDISYGPVGCAVDSLSTMVARYILYIIA